MSMAITKSRTHFFGKPLDWIARQNKGCAVVVALPARDNKLYAVTDAMLCNAAAAQSGNSD